MQIVDFLLAYGPWAWIIAGLILLALELVIPGGFLLWLGIAGIVTGLAAMIQPISLPMQWGLFGVLSLIAIFAWLRFFRARPQVTDRPYLNRRAERLVGREAVLDDPVSGGYGRLVLEDTVWRVAGPDLPAGTRVKIVGADGTVLLIEAA